MSDKCGCYYDSETGYRDYCAEHESEIADRAMEVDEQRNHERQDKPAPEVAVRCNRD